MFFDVEFFGPLVGPTTGDTEVRFPIDLATFPVVDWSGYFDYQEGRTDELPVDSILAQWSLQGSDYKEFANGRVTSDTPSTIYAYTPTLRAGVYTVSLSVNGRTYWPGATYSPSGNCTLSTTVRDLGGDCVQSAADCVGTFVSSGFSNLNPAVACPACCVTETQFLVYEDFDIAFADGSTSWSGRSSGYDPETQALLTNDIRVEFGTSEYVDPELVCCFWFAPRDANFDPIVGDDDADFVDRVLLVEGTFPRQRPEDSSFQICGPGAAALNPEGTIVTCSPPALPVWIDEEYIWQVKIG